MRAHVTPPGEPATRRLPLELWEAGPPDSEIRFMLRHLVLAEISGVVRRWHAILGLDRERPARSSIELVVDAASLETGLAERDEHIRSAEFLDVQSFPEIRFRSTEVRPDGDQSFVVVGDLTVRDVTREVVVAGEYEETGSDAALVLKAHAMVDRQELRLHWNQDLDRGGVVVGDQVDLDIRLRAHRISARNDAPARPDLARARGQ